MCDQRLTVGQTRLTAVCMSTEDQVRTAGSESFGIFRVMTDGYRESIRLQRKQGGRDIGVFAVSAPDPAKIEWFVGVRFQSAVRIGQYVNAQARQLLHEMRGIVVALDGIYAHRRVQICQESSADLQGVGDFRSDTGLPRAPAFPVPVCCSMGVPAWDGMRITEVAADDEQVVLLSPQYFVYMVLRPTEPPGVQITKLNYAKPVQPDRQLWKI